MASKSTQGRGDDSTENYKIGKKGQQRRYSSDTGPLTQKIYMKTKLYIIKLTTQYSGKYLEY